MPESLDLRFMQRALELARRAAEHGEVPVGAVVVSAEQIIGEGWNRPIAEHDPTAHAEIIALRAAGRLRASYRLPGSVLYVTLEPCTMCFGAIIQARVARVVFGAADPQAGAFGGAIDLSRAAKSPHRVDAFGGVLNEQSAALLRQFFAERRA